MEDSAREKEQPDTAAMNDDEHKLTDEEIAPRAKMPTLEKFKILYDQGMTDDEIGRQAGVPPLAILSLRRRLGLPPNARRSRDRQRMFSAEFQDRDRVRDDQSLSGTEIARKSPPAPIHGGETAMDICLPCWLRGMTDAEIAAVTTFPEEMIRDWRARHRLPANSHASDQDSLGADRDTADNTAAHDLRYYYEMGWNDGDIHGNGQR